MLSISVLNMVFVFVCVCVDSVNYQCHTQLEIQHWQIKYLLLN